MTPKELKALCKVMRDNGVLSLKSDGVELVMSPEAVAQKEKKPKASKEQNLAPAEDSIPAWMKYSPEQLATWSAPDFSEKQESSEAN